MSRAENEHEPLHSVNSQQDIKMSTNNTNSDASLPVASRAVMPPVLPFALLVAAFAVILAVLGSLSAFVGGCLSTPELCLVAALDAAHANVSLANSSATDSIRVRLVAPPTFFPNFTLAQNLLGAKKLFVLSNSSGDHQVHANDSFDVIRDAIWIARSQDLGRFSRIGFACDCARAVRGTLGSSLVSLSIEANGSVDASLFTNASTNAPAALVDTDALHDAWALPASTSLDALPSAVFAPTSDHALVFVDLATMAKEDTEPQFNRSAIVAGDLRKPPLAFAQLNASYTLRPSFVGQRTAAGKNDSTLYFFVRRADANCTASCFTVARSPSRDTLLSHDPEIEYIAAVDAKNPSSVQWTADASKAVAPIGYDCEITSVLPDGLGLCIGYSVWNNATNSSTNSVQLVQITEPWFGQTLVPALLTSAPGTNNTFLSTVFHSETATLNTTSRIIGFSTVANDVSSSPLAAFWLLEQRVA
jgi:hypothetical protein